MPKKLQERPAPTPTDAVTVQVAAPTPTSPRAASKTAQRTVQRPVQRTVAVDPQVAGATQAPAAAPRRAKKTPVAKSSKTNPSKANPSKTDDAKTSQVKTSPARPARSSTPKKSAQSLAQPALIDLPEVVQPVAAPESILPEPVKAGRAGKSVASKAANSQPAPAPVKAEAPSKPRRAARAPVAEVFAPELSAPELSAPELPAAEPVQARRSEAVPVRASRKGKAATPASRVQQSAVTEPAEDEKAAAKLSTPARAAPRNRRKSQPPVESATEVVQLSVQRVAESVAALRQGRQRKVASPKQAVKAVQIAEPSAAELTATELTAAEVAPRRPAGRGRQAAALKSQGTGVANIEPANPSGEDDSAEQASGAVNAEAPQTRTRTPRPKRGRKGAGEALDQAATGQSATVQTDDLRPTTGPTRDDIQSNQVSPAHQVSPEARELIIAQLRKLGRPVHVRDFERTFTRQGREKLGVRRDLAGLLEDLAVSGDVIRTRRHTYGLPEAMNLVRGRFQASAGGFGFVIPDSGGDDFYIREGETLEAWNGDIVLIRPEGHSGGNDRFNERGSERAGSRGGNRRNDSPRAAVVRIVTRAYSQLVGSLDHQNTYAFLKPDDHRARHRIMLLPDGTEGLPNGARVVTQLFWPEHTGEDEVYGEIVRVLGFDDDPATETQAVIVKYGLRDAFPDDVLREAEAIPRRFPESALNGRLDLREYNIFTVDGSDAKDFDDAIHIQATPEGTFVVGIHIADVSHYVRPGTALDTEAYARATSVYLPGAVLPMLPEHLSNGVCSLVPDEDRLTMSAMLELSEGGEVLSATFTPSVIRSKARLTYDEVQAYSEAVATLQGSARVLEGDLHLLLKITAKLRQKRLREGSLDFKMREVKVDVGKDGHMQLIPLREETARGMIEDLMLLANKAVAHFLLEKNVPTLFRIHEEPTLARFHDVTGAIGRMGLSFPGGEPTPQAYQAVLKSVRGTPQETAVNTLLLRSMQQAKYAGENLGHFGLAFEEYLHFTSPIRRYPDLLVHRALRAALEGPVSDKVRGDLATPLPEQGRHTSERERTASDAERDLTKYYQAKWAQEHIGESFAGRVSGVIASGLFVALENGVEGRLHISNLDDDYYFYIEEASILKGRTSGRIYRIGETIEVTVSTVSPLARQIDFTQENSMDGNDNRPRARRREDRESTKREKLSSFMPPRPGEAQAEQSESQHGETQQVQAQQVQVPSSSAPAPQGQQQQLQRGGSGRGGVPREGTTSSRGTDSPRSSEGRASEPRAPRRENAQARTPASTGNSSGGFRRRVVTLDRPRNEHLRPVNVTVQRMYFGDWTLENMPPDEGQGGGGQGGGSYGGGGYSGGARGGTFRGRGAQQSGGSRSGGASNARSAGDQNRRPQQASRDGAHGGGAHAGGTQGGRAQPDQAAAPAQAGAAATGAAADEARRRRRRRGRRGGNGQSGQ